MIVICNYACKAGIINFFGQCSVLAIWLLGVQRVVVLVQRFLQMEELDFLPQLYIYDVVGLLTIN